MIDVRFECDECGNYENFTVTVNGSTQAIEVHCNECDEDETEYY